MYHNIQRSPKGHNEISINIWTERKKVVLYLSVSACCVSVSVSVRASMVCTPGESARNAILIDWHVAGRRGLSSSFVNDSQEDKNCRPTQYGPGSPAVESHI